MSNTKDRHRRQSKSPSGLVFAGVALISLGGGCSKDEPPAPAGPDFSIAPAANDKAFLSPFDAVPDPDGNGGVYFTAISPGEGAAVFKAGADGAAPTKLFAGAPLVSPFGITISDDGQTLFVADVGAETETEEGGMIFSLPVAGGTPFIVKGTEGTMPRGLEIQGDQIYYSGTSGKRPKALPAVFKIPVAGGAPAVLASGLPLKDPSGIAVTKAGQVYVLDTAAADTKRATVFTVADGVATPFVADISVGYPGGIALSLDDKSLLVSALDATLARDIVYVVSIATKEMAPFNKSIDKFYESAGLHRARRAGTFAWADRRANKTGTVFVLK